MRSAPHAMRIGTDTRNPDTMSHDQRSGRGAGRGWGPRGRSRPESHGYNQSNTHDQQHTFRADSGESASMVASGQNPQRHWTPMSNGQWQPAYDPHASAGPHQSTRYGYTMSPGQSPPVSDQYGTMPHGMCSTPMQHAYPPAASPYTQQQYSGYLSPRAPRNTLPLHHRNTHRTHYGSNSIRLPLRLPITREHGTLRHRARHHTSIRQRFRRSIRPNSMPAHICRPDTMRKCPRMEVDHPASSNRGSTMLRHARNSLRLARHLLAAPRH